MTAPHEPAGWAWFDAELPADPGEAELCRACARCFSGAEGQLVADHLRRVVLERRLPPDASHAELRHLEGQRYAIAHLLALAERGRNA